MDTLKNKLSISQQEAYINEYKGYLFEFLVASQFARAATVENKFYQSIPKEHLDRLMSYEAKIRVFDPALLSSILELSKKTFLECENYLVEHKVGFYSRNKIKNVHLVGRSKSIKNEEADIVLEMSDEVIEVQKFRAVKIPISLKMSKSNAFVNTKSGGIKSFLSTYFSYSDKAEMLQEKVNLVVDIAFSKMVNFFHDNVGLDLDGLGFSQEWSDSNFAELPGELPKELKNQLLAYYNEVSKILLDSLHILYNDNPKMFRGSFLPICGIGNDEIMQVILFYDVNKDGFYIYEKVLINNYEKIIHNLESLNFSKTFEKRTDSSFEFICLDFLLQLRVKPMNKFTVPALKVNCSIKYLS